MLSPSLSASTSTLAQYFDVCRHPRWHNVFSKVCVRQAELSSDNSCFIYFFAQKVPYLQLCNCYHLTSLIICSKLMLSSVNISLKL